MIVARSADRPVLTAPLTVPGAAAAPRTGVERRIPAVDFDDHEGVAVVAATRADGDAFTPAGPARPATLLFRETDLSGASAIEVETAREGDRAVGGRLEVRAGSRVPAGIEVPVTGDRYAWTSTAVELAAPLHGVHDLSLTLHGDFRLSVFRFGAAG
ncbi:carbohydrate-binding protein [Streptomyces vietnamensis]|uniref:carbohydrate-binding protein n=1 Tax=Streptomyces vietnamensis TaxID=362257 RepID=UPI0037B0FC74